MKRQKMLEQRTPMSEDQKKKSAPKVAKKSVGFAEEVDDEEKKNEPVKESQYLPENKPKPILKSSSTFDEPLQGKIEKKYQKSKSFIFSNSEFILSSTLMRASVVI